jgi:hypothetical protein
VEDDPSVLCGACGVKEMLDALITPIGPYRNLFIFFSLLCPLGRMLV